MFSRELLRYHISFGASQPDEDAVFELCENSVSFLLRKLRKKIRNKEVYLSV